MFLCAQETSEHHCRERSLGNSLDRPCLKSSKGGKNAKAGTKGKSKAARANRHGPWKVPVPAPS